MAGWTLDEIKEITAVIEQIASFTGANVPANETVYQEALRYLLNKAVLRLTAEDIAYDNATSGLTAEDVQAAIDELDQAIENLRDNTVLYAGEFDNYSDLTGSISPGTPGRFAFVLNSQGSSFWPGSLGGTYYSAGWYYDTGSTWANKNDEVLAGLEGGLIDVINITADYNLPAISSFTRHGLRLINRSGDSWTVTANGSDTIEDETSVTIVDGETFDITPVTTNWVT